MFRPKLLPETHLRAGALMSALLVAFVAAGAPRSLSQNRDAGTERVSVEVEDGTKKVLYEGSYALVVGASKYDTDKGWQSLPGVLEDVRAVKTALEAHGFTVETVIDPTRAAFDQKMREFIDRYGQKENNRLLVYFAGHGATVDTVDGRNLGYIVPSDAPLPDRDKVAFKRKAISMEEVSAVYARQIESKHVLFIFDSCFSGSIFHLMPRSVPAGGISTKMFNPVRQFITAGTDKQRVPDRSVFRRQFVKALEGRADANNDHRVTGTELGVFLYDKVEFFSKGAQTPIFGKIFDPALNEGEFVFSLLQPGEEKPRFANAINVMELLKQVDPERQSSVDMADLNHWLTIANSNDPEDFQEYLSKYPKGAFAKVAMKRRQAGTANRQRASRSDVAPAVWPHASVQFTRASYLVTTAGPPPPKQDNQIPAAAQEAAGMNPNESWFVILGSYPLTRQDKANALMIKYQARGYDARLINSNWGDFPNFARSLWVIVIGPGTQREARDVARELRSTVRYPRKKDRPYIKQAVKF
jgi:cell division septation protein DedD